MYGSTLSLTLALDGDGWSIPRPGCFTPGKETRYPLYGRLGGPQGRSGRVRKISPPPGLDPRTVQPVANRYKDYAIPAHIIIIIIIIISSSSSSSSSSMGGGGGELGEFYFGKGYPVNLSLILSKLNLSEISSTFDSLALSSNTRLFQAQFVEMFTIQLHTN